MPLEIMDDDFMVCTDCLVIIADDDTTGLDYSLLNRLSRGWLPKVNLL